MNASKRTAALLKIRSFCERELQRAGVKPRLIRATVDADLAQHGVAQWSGKKLRAVARVC